jgi:hypothetical protein
MIIYIKFVAKVSHCGISPDYFLMMRYIISLCSNFHQNVRNRVIRIFKPGMIALVDPRLVLKSYLPYYLLLCIYHCNILPHPKPFPIFTPSERFVAYHAFLVFFVFNSFHHLNLSGFFSILYLLMNLLL